MTTSTRIKTLTPAFNVNSKSDINYALILKALCAFLFSHIVSYDEKNKVFEVEWTLYFILDLKFITYP